MRSFLPAVSLVFKDARCGQSIFFHLAFFTRQFTPINIVSYKGQSYGQKCDIVNVFSLYTFIYFCFFWRALARKHAYINGFRKFKFLMHLQIFIYKNNAFYTFWCAFCLLCYLMSSVFAFFASSVVIISFTKVTNWAIANTP